jgi:YD repeat-containing protein
MQAQHQTSAGALGILIGATAGLCSFQVVAAEAMLLPPEYATQDRNHVDIASLKASFDVTDVSIGSSGRPLENTVRISDPETGQSAITYDFDGSVTPQSVASSYWQAATSYYGCSTTGGVKVKLGRSTESFCLLGSSYVSIRNPANTLIKNADGSYLYTTGDGTKYTFQQVTTSGDVRLVSKIMPDGLATQTAYWLFNGTDSQGQPRQFAYVQSVSRNDGFQLRLKYVPDRTLSGAKAVNTAVEYCDPLSNSCSTTNAWPESSYSFAFPDTNTDQFTVIDQGGRSMRITWSGTPKYISAFKPSTSAAQDTVTYQYCNTAEAGHWLCIATKDGFSWQYNLGLTHPGSLLETYMALTSQGPTANTVFFSHTASPAGVLAPLMYSVLPDGRRDYDQSAPTNRLLTFTHHGGQVATYSYDSRGNVTSATHTPQPGSALTAVSLSAGYDTLCSNPVKCNKPNWVRDGKGNQTDYTYDSVHGGVLSVTRPAVPVSVGGTVTQVRPQTRYGYVQRYAWYKNSSGTAVQASSPIWLLSTEKSCRTSAANGAGCTTAGDEVVTTYDYGPTTGANNLFVRGKAVTADGVTLRTCYSYDIFGNQISETSPNAGLASCP